MVNCLPDDTNIVPVGALEPGMYILPTYIGGASPFKVALEIHATPTPGEGYEVTEYCVDFDDGKTAQGKFTQVKDGQCIAHVEHTYVFNKTGKYTGHTFYPNVTVKTAKGALKTMNHNHQKACSVWVYDPKYS